MSLPLLQTALLMPVEAALNHLLTLDAASGARLAALEGQTLAVHSTRPVSSLFISVHQRQLSLAVVGSPDLAQASLRGSATSLLQLLLAREPISNLAPLGVELQGSTKLVQALQLLLKDLDIDWQFYLSRIVGDLPVEAASRGIKQASAYLQRSAADFRENVHDYLTYESHLLPSLADAEKFYAGITALSLRIDRLQAKIAALPNP